MKDFYNSTKETLLVWAQPQFYVKVHTIVFTAKRVS